MDKGLEVRMCIWKASGKRGNIIGLDGSINLKAQNTRIQKVLKTAILELKKASIFDNAFPNITQKQKMALDAVHNAAGKHKEYAILKRVKHDFYYAVALAGVPEGQLSSFHTNLKKLAHQIVVSRFALKKGCTEEVENLIKSHKYIFPTDAKGKVLGDQPFCDESMIDTIRLSFFDSEDSIGVQSRCEDKIWLGSATLASKNAQRKRVEKVLQVKESYN
ncbi:hypothetical protein F4604DRAFT_1922659 [Suillus subluteus]|nr:hypothetical protein F4604DRAFT_1922659 [Suillus subluteus]